MTNLPISLIIDIAVVAILVIGFISGWKKGLLKTVAGLIALVAAFLLATPVADLATEKLMDPVMEIVEQKMTENVKQELEKNLDAFTENVKNGTSEQLEELLKENNLGFLEPYVGEFLENLKKEGSEPAEGQSPVDKAFESLMKTVRTLVQKLIHGICFILAFALLLVLLRLILNVIAKALSKTPIIGQVNSIGGAVIGLLETAFILWLIISVVNWLNIPSIQPYLDGSAVVKFVTTMDISDIISDGTKVINDMTKKN